MFEVQCRVTRRGSKLSSSKSRGEKLLERGTASCKLKELKKAVFSVTMKWGIR